MLDHFFTINLPYGLVKNEKGEWMAFNREYMSLGFNGETEGLYHLSDFNKLPVYSAYKGLSEKLLLEIGGGEDGVNRDENGDIWRVWLYNDRTNPTAAYPREQKALYSEYFKKLERLARLRVKRY